MGVGGRAVFSSSSSSRDPWRGMGEGCCRSWGPGSRPLPRAEAHLSPSPPAGDHSLQPARLPQPLPPPSPLSPPENERENRRGWGGEHAARVDVVAALRPQLKPPGWVGQGRGRGAGRREPGAASALGTRSASPARTAPATQTALLRNDRLWCRLQVLPHQAVQRSHCPPSAPPGRGMLEL